MINTGYLFSNNRKRLFINTSLGRCANCSFCYLPLLNYKKGNEINNYVNHQFIIKELNKWKDFKEGPDGTLISFGCFSECFDKKSKRNHLFN